MDLSHTGLRQGVHQWSQRMGCTRRVASHAPGLASRHPRPGGSQGPVPPRFPELVFRWLRLVFKAVMGTFAKAPMRTRSRECGRRRRVADRKQQERTHARHTERNKKRSGLTPYRQQRRPCPGTILQVSDNWPGVGHAPTRSCPCGGARAGPTPTDAWAILRLPRRCAASRKEISDARDAGGDRLSTGRCAAPGWNPVRGSMQ